MPLAPGTRVGAYEILSALGAGGMGEVYRALDTGLGREIALKTLPASFTGDPERIARFRREAQVLASLNHPHIGAIYGLEEANGTQLLVLELVDGESLDKRLARGAIALDEALAVAGQIAEALEAAHEKGIVHRDLKPANVALTKDGAVKLLDFGLAKAVETTSGSFDLTNSPTMNSPAMMTAAGVILGTAPYMSPEQAKGRAADKRADIWAFGCVLYEMLAGERAFRGEDVSDALANVLKSEPAWDALPRHTPTSVRHLLRRCLSKDPSQRLRDIGDARLELTDAFAESDSAPRADTRWRGTRVAAIAVWAVAGIAAGVFGSFLLSRSPSAAPVTRWTVLLPADAPVDLRGPWSSLAISRDGRSILYVAQTNNGRELFLRRADDLTAHVVGGTAGVWEAFFSPDGDWIGFIAADRVKKVAVTGGQPVAIGDAANFNSGLWADDGTIYLGGRAGLARMSAEGRLTQLVKPASNEGRLSHPDLLPDGSVLFTIEPNDVTSFDDARIAVVTPKGDRRVVLEGGAYARYSPTGHILYVRGGEIMAAPFDAQRLSVTGRPAGVVDGGSFDAAAGAAYFAVSRTGVLVYVPGGPLMKQRSMAWSDRHGELTPIPAPRRFYAEPSISPDQRQIAFTLRAANDDIWTFDVARGSFARLTFPHGNSEVPIWSPDGRRIVYAVDRDGVRRLFWRPADGSGS